MEKRNKKSKYKQKDAVQNKRDIKSDSSTESRLFWILCLYHLRFSAHFLNIKASHVNKRKKKSQSINPHHPV